MKHLVNKSLDSTQAAQDLLRTTTIGGLSNGSQMLSGISSIT